MHHMLVPLYICLVSINPCWGSFHLSGHVVPSTSFQRSGVQRTLLSSIIPSTIPGIWHGHINAAIHFVAACFLSAVIILLGSVPPSVELGVNLSLCSAFAELSSSLLPSFLSSYIASTAAYPVV